MKFIKGDKMLPKMNKDHIKAIFSILIGIGIVVGLNSFINTAEDPQDKTIITNNINTPVNKLNNPKPVVTMNKSIKTINTVRSNIPKQPESQINSTSAQEEIIKNMRPGERLIRSDPNTITLKVD
jgi:hypothetical protein